MKNIVASILLIVFIGSVSANGTIDIIFNATGAATTVDSIKVENLELGISLELKGADVLSLTNITSIVNSSKTTDIQVFPNPVYDQGEIRINASVAGMAQIRIVDVSGNIVFIGNSEIRQGNQSIYFNGLGKGLYFMSIRGGGISITTSILSLGTSLTSTGFEFHHDFFRTDKIQDGTALLKNSQSVISMPYTPGDRLRFIGFSGQMTDTVNDIPNASKTITFNFQHNLSPIDVYHQIDFSSNGGSSVESLLSVPYGTLITAPDAPAKTGYTFAGWYNKELTLEWNFGESVVVSDTTLYAKWQPITYQLRYDLNGGTGSIDITNFIVGDEVTVADASTILGPEIKDGITQKLIRWNTQADGSGSIRTPGATRTLNVWDTVFYAIWTADTTVIGKVCPGRGIVFYVHDDSDADWKYLSADTKDFGPLASGNDYKWSHTKTDIATSHEIGTGLENSLAIKNNQGAYSSIAARAALGHVKGPGDWFLPSYYELQEMYTQRAVIGGFTNNYYWSSSQANINEGISIGMSTGTVIYRDKTEQSRRIRPIRRF